MSAVAFWLRVLVVFPLLALVLAFTARAGPGDGRDLLLLADGTGVAAGLELARHPGVRTTRATMGGVLAAVATLGWMAAFVVVSFGVFCGVLGPCD